MIQRGNTIVFKREDGAMDFYWLVEKTDDYDARVNAEYGWK